MTRQQETTRQQVNCKVTDADRRIMALLEKSMTTEVIGTQEKWNENLHELTKAVNDRDVWLKVRNALDEL
jgi:hypothetical protein